METDNEWICKGFLRVHFTIQQGGKVIYVRVLWKNRTGRKKKKKQLIKVAYRLMSGLSNNHYLLIERLRIQ